MILKSHNNVKVKVKDYSNRGVSLSNLPTEKLVSDLLNFWPNDVLIVTIANYCSLSSVFWAGSR